MNGSEPSLMLDTNILLHHSIQDIDETKHHACVALITQCVQQKIRLYTSWQNLREFYAIATNSRILMRPLSPQAALERVHAYHHSLVVLTESEQIVARCLELLTLHPCTKAKVHDYNIAATLLAHGVSALATFNAKDFKPLGIPLLDPTTLEHHPILEDSPC